MLKRKLKTLMSKLRYLKMDLEDHNIFVNQWDIELRTALTEYANIKKQEELEQDTTEYPTTLEKKSYGIKIEFKDPEDFKKQDLKPPTKNKDAPPLVGKLYRKIAALTHPDKLEHEDISEAIKKEKEAIYIKATKAFEEGRFEELIDLAVEFNLDLPNPSKDLVKALDKRAKTLEQEINKIEKNTAWVWGNGNDKIKQILLQKAYKNLYPDKN